MSIGYGNMADQEKAVSDAVQILQDNDVDLKTFIHLVGMQNAAVMQMRDEDQQEFCKWFDTIDSSRSDRKHKGKNLETLADILFRKAGKGLFTTRHNIRTSSNEIDLPVSWTELVHGAVSNGHLCAVKRPRCGASGLRN